jgi:uncharacterized protein
MNCFDPFTDRPSREIRNRLSESLMHALDARRADIFESFVSELLVQNPVQVYRSYVEDRLSRYRESLSEIASQGLTDKIFQALVLWNHGLFFEAHERLEAVWRESSGERKAALKGLIQAAGVFVHMEQGRVSSADRLSAKARDLLEKHGGLLPIDLGDLLKSLKEGHRRAPRLRGC